MKLGYIYSGKVLGNLAPGGVDPYTGDPSHHVLECDLGEGGAIDDTVCPLTIMADTWDNWGDPSAINSDLYGLRILVAAGATPAGSSTILRLEPNVNAGVTIASAICIPQNGPDRLSYLLDLAPPTADAWAYTSGTHTGENGFLKVRLGTHDRWIQLYDTYVA